jgi:uncharacterized protein YjbI with pentapeptide repeats
MITKLAMTEGAVAQHKSWLAGQAGAPRLVVTDQTYADANFHVWELSGIRIEGCKFSDSDFRNALLKDAELLTSEFRRCLFLSARLQGAMLIDLYFEHCNLNVARLNGATGQGCTLAETQAFRSQWLDTKISKFEFMRCSLHDSTWTNAVVSNSDFRGSYLGATKGFGLLATTAGATFTDCDFRNTSWRGRDLSGATFVRCKFKKSDDETVDANGAPRASDGLTLKDCDVTTAELLTDLLRADDVPLPD